LKAQRLLSFDDLRTVKGIAYSRAHMWRLVRDGKFPKPIHLGQGSKPLYVEAEIDAWINKRIAERDAA
jgi:prophage regulatory protein